MSCNHKWVEKEREKSKDNKFIETVRWQCRRCGMRRTTGESIKSPR